MRLVYLRPYHYIQISNAGDLPTRLNSHKLWDKYIWDRTTIFKFRMQGIYLPSISYSYIVSFYMTSIFETLPQYSKFEYKGSGYLVPSIGIYSWQKLLTNLCKLNVISVGLHLTVDIEPTVSINSNQRKAIHTGIIFL